MSTGCVNHPRRPRVSFMIGNITRPTRPLSISISVIVRDVDYARHSPLQPKAQLQGAIESHIDRRVLHCSASQLTILPRDLAAIPSDIARSPRFTHYSSVNPCLTGSSGSTTNW